MHMFATSVINQNIDDFDKLSIFFADEFFIRHVNWVVIWYAKLLNHQFLTAPKSKIPKSFLIHRIQKQITKLLLTITNKNQGI